MRDPNFARSITSVRIMVETGIDHGLPIRTSLLGTGISESDLSDPAALVSNDQELQVARNLVERLGSVPALGVEAGMRTHFTAFGILGLAMASCPNPRTALDVAMRYFNLTFAFDDFLVTDIGHCVQITLKDNDIPEDVRRFVIERDCAAIVRVQRDLAPVPAVHAVHFSYPCPPYVERYEAAFGVRPFFGAKQSSVIIDLSCMPARLPQANDVTRRAAEEQCRLLIDKRRQGVRLSLKVRDRLIRDSAQMPDMDSVAKDLCMTTRTLRRRLAEEETSFTAIRDEVRLTLAEELLSTTELPIAQIAERLGYTDPTSFIVAFKGWKGVTPLAYRKQIPAAK